VSVTDSPSEPEEQDEPAEQGEPEGEESVESEVDAARAVLAEEIADLVGATGWSTDHATVKVKVDRESWTRTLTKARDEAGLDYFSFLSAIDWSREVAVGDPVEEPDGLEERYELLCAVGTTTDDRFVVFSTELAKDDASIDSLTDVFGGANWHEREANEMFGIHFRGHPRLVKLYLPDAFEGHPLRKSYPLLSREVKPWPGKVDVEDMPSTENPEAPDAAPEAEGEKAE
jgi:NADH-quinone oxidoreductase subunit C